MVNNNHRLLQRLNKGLLPDLLPDLQEYHLFEDLQNVLHLLGDLLGVEVEAELEVEAEATVGLQEEADLDPILAHQEEEEVEAEVEEDEEKAHHLLLPKYLEYLDSHLPQLKRIWKKNSISLENLRKSISSSTNELEGPDALHLYILWIKKTQQKQKKLVQEWNFTEGIFELTFPRLREPILRLQENTWEAFMTAAHQDETEKDALMIVTMIAEIEIDIQDTMIGDTLPLEDLHHQEIITTIDTIQEDIRVILLHPF